MEIKQYAPVIIPTLNRHVHFKRCLESLECCTWADKTDVYVALDYPPSEKYVEGWKLNDAYLHEKENNHRFKSLNVIRRETNYFMQGKVYDGIIEMATKYIDCYITSEDDNEFAPAFLDFMNRAFEKYKNDENVLSVSGYCHPDFNYCGEDNTLLSYETTAWGIGFWLTKRNKMVERMTIEYFENFLSDWKKSLKVMSLCPALFNMLLGVMYKYKHCDVQMGIYNFIEGTTQLRPVHTLVKNWGYDGSGVNCDKGNTIELDKQKLLGDKYFDFSDNVLAANSPSCLKFYRKFNIPSNIYYKYKYYFAVIRNYIHYLIKHL